MKQAVKETSKSMNYSKPWTGGPLIPFKHLEFNIVYHRLMLKSMLAGSYVKAKGRMPAVSRDKTYRESMKGC